MGLCMGKCEALVRAHLEYLLQAGSVVSMNEAFRAGRCWGVPGHGQEDGGLVIPGQAAELGLF